jgi:4-hydroxy-L-threonine phosphate dehydrogenase PdxA
MTAQQAKQDKIVVGISIGDLNGIGPEVVLSSHRLKPYRLLRKS